MSNINYMIPKKKRPVWNPALEPVECQPVALVSLPLLGWVAAGEPLDLCQDNERVDVPANMVRRNSYALRVRGHFGEADTPCGQPITTGDLPKVTDCLFILQAAVSLVTCAPQCVCDVNSSNSVTVADALRCLQVSTQVPGADLDCPCPG